MSTHPGAAGEAPQQLLAGSRQLARRVRDTQRATWFPLLVLAVVTFAAVPVYRYGHYALNCRNQPGGGRICAVSPTTAWIYWPIALVLAYLVIAGFYLHRARARGVGTRVLPYAVAGVAIAVLVTAVAVWVVARPPVGEYDFLGLHLAPGHAPWLFLLFSPTAAIGLGLLVLAAVERSPVLFLLAIGYVAFALVPPDNLGWVISRPSPWSPVPRLVIGGSVLLLAALGFALLQRPRHRAAA